jgi:hypothetical protein
VTDLYFENQTYGRIKLQRSRLRLWEQFLASGSVYTVSADPEKISFVKISFLFSYSRNTLAVLYGDADGEKMVGFEAVPAAAHRELTHLSLEYRVPVRLVAYAMHQLPQLRTLELGHPMKRLGSA